MKSLWINLMIIAALLVAGCQTSIAQTPEQLYQKGLMKEEGEGALQDAISLYDQIADNSNADLSLRAKALLHIGMCYERMGAQGAVKAYQRLVNNFPTQKNEVSIATERLSRLLLLAEHVPETPPAMKFTKLEIPTKPGNGVLSPDGKKLAYIADSALWSVPVQGKTKSSIAGEPTRLTKSMDAWDLANMCAVWSANSKWLAFYAKRNRKDDIYILSANGGNPSKVDVDQKRLDISGYDYRMSLSPDGKMLAIVNRDDNNKPFIYTISVQEGTLNRLTGPGTREPAFSHDGKFIAYVKTKPARNLGDEIWVIPSAGGEPVLVSDDADVVKSPVWSPDGLMIAFLARKYEKGWANNSNELWITAIDRYGNPTGLITKTVLNNSTTSMLAGWSPDNKIGVWLSTPEKNFLFTVPAAGGQAMQVTSKNSWMPCYSPDGNYLYFDGENTDKFAGLEYVPVTGGDVQRIPIRFKDIIQPAMPTGGISVSPDGQKIVFATYYNDADEPTIQKKQVGFHHIITVPVNGGSPVQLTTNSLVDGYPVWSPDGKSIAFIRHENKTDPLANIYTIPAEGGTPRKVTSANDKVTYGRIDWSRDGKWIGFFSADSTIKMIPVVGGNSKVVVKDLDTHSHFGLSFSPEGDKITYSNKEKLYAVNLNTGSREEVRTGLDGVPTMPAWSPDGKKIAFCAYTEEETDLWFMEDFLPLEKKSEIMIAEEPEGIRINQVWESPYLDDLGTVSYDGQFRSCVDWKGSGDLAIHNLISGEIRPLTHKASLGDTGSFVLNTAISKNGKQIVSTWWRPYNTTDLVLYDVENSTSNLLYSQKGEEIYPSTWLSDYEIVGIRLIPETRTMQMVSVNTLNKTLQVKKTFDKYQNLLLACSPDEKYIAYDFTNDADEGNFDINILTADGNGDIPLIKHPANDRVFGWFPGRKEFLFISDRSGSWDLWAITLDDGKTSGPARRIYSDIGEVSPMGFTQNGNCYFGFVRRKFYSSITPFNKETGEINLGSGISMKSSNYDITWSPDGQYLAYLKLDDYSLVILDLKTGEEHKPSDKIFKPWGYSWSPDGNSILAVGKEKNQIQTKGYKGDIFLIDIETGQTDEILQLSDYEYNVPEGDEFPLSELEWFTDGKSFYYLFFKDRLVKHDLETGKDKILFKYPGFTRHVLDLSPDGTSLLFGLRYPDEKKSRLFTIPAEGGKENELCTAQEARGFATAFWSPDGTYIYFVELLDNIKTNLWRVPSTGGIPEKVWSSENRVDIFNIHPDGNQVAFSIRERKTEVRAIENLREEIAEIFDKEE